MKCLYCKLPIESASDAFVTIPNPEQCGYKARQATKFVHARCFEKEIRRTANTDLLTAAKELLRAYEQLMPGLVHIAVQDYANINEAPILAKSAIARAEAR